MNEQLPPLPEHPKHVLMGHNFYTADQMRDYAHAAVSEANLLAANEKVTSRATDIATALAIPGCERLREWAEIGPVQRAAVEEFAYALAAKVPADPCLVLWKAMNQAGKVGKRTDDKLIVKFLRDAGYRIAPAPAPEATPAQAQQAGEPLTNIESPFNACQHREHCKGWKMVATDVVAKAKPEAQQPLSDADLDALMGPGQEFVAELPSGSIISVHAAFGRSQVREAMRAAIGAVRGIGASGASGEASNG